MQKLNKFNSPFLGKQIAAQQPIDMQHDLENQQPVQYNQTSPTTSFQLPQHQFNQQASSAFSPASKTESPQLASSPLSTIGTELSLSPQQFPRANSFDLGLLRNQTGLLSSTLLQQQSDLKTPTSVAFDMTPPQSAGLAAPIPLNPTQNAPLNYENLLALTQLLAPQQPVVSTSSLLSQLVQAHQSTTNLQDLLSLVNLLQQFQGQQLSPPPVEKSPHKPNGFVDVCSV